MKRFSLRYLLLTWRFDQIWLPLAFWALFIIVAIFTTGEQFNNIARAYLGGVVPLIGGIMAAYAILDDPALELRFATPILTLQTLFERLGLIFVIQAISALAYQVFALQIMHGDFSMFASLWHLQLAWILPTLSLMALGALCALLAAQPTIGAMAVGLVWIVEVIARGWLALNAGKYVLVFMGMLMPDHPDLLANHIVLFILSLLFLAAAWALLNRQERYI